MEEHDLIIIGNGPAGLSAAIYSSRYHIDFTVIGSNPGGYAGMAHEIVNFPSYEKISGVELITRMITHAKNLGANIVIEEVQDINKKKGGFIVKTNRKEYWAKKIILATGFEKKKLNVEGERDFIGRGISYCATCDASFYKNKTVAVIGGSNSALSAAILVGKYAKKIYIVYRKDKFEDVEKKYLQEIEKNKKFFLLFNSEIKKIIGKEKLEGIEIERNRKKEILKLDGVFVEIGGLPNTALAEKLKIKIDKEGIIVDNKQKTNVEGIFAAGDVTNNQLKQIITACGQGAVAANTAYKELKGEK